MNSARFRKIIAILATIAGILYAIRIAWVCDDAFISFRYALNLARGKGLVFNVGEYVEGYTNFLWTLLMTPFLALGWDPIVPSEVLGVLSFAGLLVVVYRLGSSLRCSAPDSKPGPIPTPAIAALAVHYHMLVFATSGLETMLFTLLVTSASLLIVRVLNGGPENEPNEATVAFLLLTLSAMTRPDGLLFYAVSAGFVFLRRVRLGESLLSRGTLISHLPFALLFLPFLVWKYYYYGSVIPNTFYAKSAYSPYPWQGLLYAGLYFLSYWPLCFLILGGIFLTIRMRGAIGFGAGYITSLCFLWTLYIVWVGGDFMFARFLIPITPLLVLGLEAVLLASISVIRPTRMEPASTILTLLLPIAILARWDPFSSADALHRSGITEENRVYTPNRLAQGRSIALQIKPTIQRVDPPVAFVGAQAWLVYYLDVTTAIEAETGLTDAVIARQSLTVRGKIGHEKAATIDYLKQRGVAWIFRPPKNSTTDILRIDGLPGDFEIIRYDERVFRELSSDPRFHVLRRKQSSLDNKKDP